MVYLSVLSQFPFLKNATFSLRPFLMRIQKTVDAWVRCISWVLCQTSLVFVFVFLCVNGKKVVRWPGLIQNNGQCPRVVKKCWQARWNKWMDEGVMCDRRTTESGKGSIVNVNIEILSNFFQKSFSPVFYPIPFAFDKKNG